ncbi:hypothetical protein [Mesorhizobium sp. M1406]|uniref:hypothetical protein n=1 Tax=Mesorhizobium sp. M1406 TaxID=2957099 RepID=UPI0033372C47
MGLWNWLFGTTANELHVNGPDLSDIVVPISDDDGIVATKYQLEALERLGCGKAMPGITFRQAGAILSARTYSKFLLDDLLSRTGVRHPKRPQYLAIQANIIAFIVRDPRARIAVCAWSDRNFDERKEDPPPRNIHWQQTVAFIGPVIAKLKTR